MVFKDTFNIISLLSPYLIPLYLLMGSFFNQDLKKAYKTIFELIPNSVSIFNEMTRGLKTYRDLTKYSKIFYKLSSHFTGSSSIDKAAFNKLEKSLKVHLFFDQNLQK